MQQPRTIYTPAFFLLCLSSFLFFASFNMLIPELPGYLTALGGAEYKGYIISLFTITAGLSRPFSGRLTDTIGRVPVMAFGSLVCFVCGFLYPLVPLVWFNGVAALLLLRLVHGFSTGFKPTGTSAYVADIVPDERRGEAMGVLGLSGSIGMAFGPALGSWLTSLFGLNALFYTSSALALLSIIILLNMKETLTNRVPFRWRLLRISRRDVFEPAVFAPSLVTFLNSFSFGAVITLAPDFSQALNVGNKGLFFTVFTISSLAIRFLAGKISDEYGRRPVLCLASLIITAAMLLLAFSTSTASFLLAGVVFGVSMGMYSPTAQAWTVDLSNSGNRGRALATMYIALEAGIGLGAYLSAYLYDNKTDRFSLAFFTIAVFSSISFLFLMGKQKKK
ncbi:MFS transporter [Larkinella humicola]|uniref:MFS transporter n=1 Tax=Larkinella humicola TaxID=2607654 RepID=A0A5N1JHE7_9BACT|nr:MFS transporter [Larkinella humicola]KAA9353178.1 MFS transporter [Larkinella humicola]